MLFFIFILLIFTGCNIDENSSSTDENLEEKNHETDNHLDDENLLIEPNNLLGFKLLHHVEPKDDNVFLSPLSAFTAVLLAYNGADGETKREMAEALHIDSYELVEVNKAIFALVNKLQKEGEDIELSLANSIWLNEQYQFDEGFSENATNYFSAEHEMIDINDDASVDFINDWVSEATNEKITEMVEKPLSKDFLAMILNAVYFNGKWQYAFDEANTTESIFYHDNNEISVLFMMLEEELPYFEDDLLQAVQLPYGTGEMSMQIFLPKENVELETFMKELTQENWTIWNSQFQTKSGTLKVPKYQIEYETSLTDGLKELGIEQAFDKYKAQFPNLIEEDEQIYIHEIKQKTFIDVSEEGTEAAGATSVEVRLTSAIVDEDNFYMEVNRPFFFTIKEEETNAILFMGLIKNPK